jgi:hypothetical protein
MYNGLWNEVINRETCLLQMKNLLSAFMKSNNHGVLRFRCRKQVAGSRL